MAIEEVREVALEAQSAPGTKIILRAERYTGGSVMLSKRMEFDQHPFFQVALDPDMVRWLRAWGMG